jgi:hypothetical protein
VKAPGIVIMAIAVVAVATVMPSGAARADVAFRKKKPAPAAEAAPAEVTPSGGETATAEGGDAPATDGETPPPAKTEFVPQAEDKDRPRDPSLLDRNSADAVLAAKAKKEKHDDTPIYKKWQLWAIVGGVVAAGLAVWGTTAILHSIGGGDVRPCPADFANACFGQGR